MMNKKVVLGIVAALIVLVAIGIGTFFSLTDDYSQRSDQSNTDANETNRNEGQDNESEKDEDSNTLNETGKVLVIYFSATNNTKNVAEKIAKNLNGDIFEIVPVDEYTSEDLNYGNPDSRVSREHDDESLRDVKLKASKVDDWDSYDTVVIGYPIWWGVAAWPVNSFVKVNNFEGKTVIPFCTSSSSGLGQSGKLLEAEAQSGTWLEGKRFSSRPSDSDVKAFTDGIK